MMGPYMTGAAGLRSMLRAMNSTREIVRNNPLRSIAKYQRKKSIRKHPMQLNRSVRIKKKTKRLSSKIKSASQSWKFFWYGSFLSLLVLLAFNNYWGYVLGATLIIVVSRIILESFLLGIYPKNLIAHSKIKTIHFRRRPSTSSSRHSPELPPSPGYGGHDGLTQQGRQGR